MQKYHWSLRILHWLVAIAVLCMIGAGIYMTSYAVAPQKWQIYATHKAIGVTILDLIILRILIRLLVKNPDMPRQLSEFEKKASILVHYLLYLLVFFTALSGYIMSSAGGRAISWFSMFNVPLLVPVNKYIAEFMHSAHEILPYVLLSVIALHVLAALKHLILDEVNIFKRII